METQRRIIIVDDSRMDTMLLKHTIEVLKYPVAINSFESSLEAIQCLEEILLKKDYINFPDIIFLDLNMPGMNGFNFLDSFMKFPAEVRAKCKIIVITSSEELNDIKKTASYPNVTDFIIKPPKKMDQIVKHAFFG